MFRKYLGYFLILIGIFIIIELYYFQKIAPNPSKPFANYTLLTASWENYKQRFLNNDGRIIDYSQNSVTTSEGQSYALIQAVYLDDKPTFDKILNWTRDNLKRPNDNLFGWRWGQLPGSQYGFYPNGGSNSAADADSDIALSLILAAKRWRQTSYADLAKAIINDIWLNETAVAAGKRYLIAGNWANSGERLVLDPSYFSPYAWRLFAQIDKAHDWNSLIAPAYDLLNRSTADPLGNNGPGVLPPDWVAISTQDGSLSPVNSANLTVNYGYDAMRLPWRIALDYQWNHNDDAKNYLTSLKFLSDYYQKNNYLPQAFSHQGAVVNNTQSPSMYATALGAISLINPGQAKTIYDQKIISLYSNDSNSFKNDLPYYEENWLWFGSALYLNYLKPIP